MTWQSFLTRRPIWIVTGIIGMCCLQGCTDVAEPIIDPSVLARGKRLGNRCVACHDMETRLNKVGPHLVGIIGRKAGTVRGYEYSRAMRGSNVKWTRENLITFLAAPDKLIPETAMVIAPLSRAEAEQLVIFLEESQ